MPTLDPNAVKRESEAIIRRAGGEICDWLPVLDRGAPTRDVGAVVRRALILNAMLQIGFQAPIAVIKDWINRNGLADDLSESEREILEKDNEDLTEQERTNLYWYIEALWAMVWAGQLIPDLDLPSILKNWNGYFRQRYLVEFKRATNLRLSGSGNPGNAGCSEWPKSARAPALLQQ